MNVSASKLAFMSSRITVAFTNRNPVSYTHLDVYKRQIVNDKSVEVTLKAEALKKDKYQVISKEDNYFGGEVSPHYQFQVTSAETFKKDLEKMQEGVPDGDRVEYKIESRNDWTGFIGTWGFFIVMILVMYFLLGRMSGGVGPGGQIFNICLLYTSRCV